tara:strand:+ start:101 stop:2041 length:1941 start_codon:yes stop_codon:yes gene_type:complete
MNQKINTFPNGMSSSQDDVNKFDPIVNPHLTKVKTMSGFFLRDYQLELCNQIIADFERALDDPAHAKTIQKYFRILQMDTGTGKTFLIQYIIEKLIKLYIKKTKRIKGTIVIMAPRNELLTPFMEMMETVLVKGLNDYGIKTKLYSSLKIGYNANHNIHTFDPNLEAMKIVIITDQINLNRDISDGINDLILAIRDESMGLDSADADVAKQYDDIHNAGLKMHDKYNKMGCFKLVLTATPSESQLYRKDIKEQFIYSYDKPLKWLKPIAKFVELYHFKNSKDKKAKENIMNRSTDEFINDILEINYNEKYAKDNNLEIPLKVLNEKPVAAWKADPRRFDYQWDVNKISKYICDKDERYAKEKKKFKVENYITKEVVEVEYPSECTGILGGYLLHPVISNEKNNYDYANLIDPDSKHNCLIVCAKGNEGINVPNLIQSTSVRPAQRPKGRAGSLKQWKGREDRTVFLTDYDIAQIIQSANITSIKHYNMLRSLIFAKISKKIHEPTTKQNVITAEEWVNKNDSYSNKLENVEKILLDNGYSIPYTKKIINGNGKTASFSYEDMRNGKSKCEVEGCRQVALIEFKRVYMEEQGKSELEANHLAVKGALQNCHILNKDGKIIIQCIIHHTVETEVKEHWRQKNDEKRIA